MTHHLGGAGGPTRRRHRGAGLVLGLLAALLAAACVPDFGSGGVGGGDGWDDAQEDGSGGFEVGDCTPVEVVVSSEKIDLITDLARDFNASDDARGDGGCAVVRPRSVASGAAAGLLSEGWPDEEADGPRPTVWSPASSAWAAVVNQRLSERGEEPIAPASRPFMLTPLVIAMPQPMAEALGYPDRPVGFADILRLARDPAGWGAHGHPEWGAFRLGKTNPNFSTSGLSALIAQAYAATGKTRGLTAEDLGRPEVDDFARGVESAVVHYGDTTLTFLNNLARADARGTGLTYASAVAVEEVSVINYNRGNPDGVLEPGEEPIPPRIPLVAVYPSEGTLFSDNPFIVLDAPWVDDAQRAAAERFGEFVQRPENQQRVLEFGFRPGNPEVAIAEPISAANGVDPAQPQTTLEVPAPAVMVELLDRWHDQRKPARVLLLVDVSGSMGDPAGEGRETKLDLAKRAAVESLDEFSDADEVGLRIFTTDIGPPDSPYWVDVVPIAAMRDGRQRLAEAIEALVPVAGTPLYAATAGAHAELLASADPQRINAVVLLSDGVNDSPDGMTLDDLLTALRTGAEGRLTSPVRVFPIAYGRDADLATLRRIAEATDAAAYDAGDPRSITKVFAAVVSNF